jgi:hypothetical protein
MRIRVMPQPMKQDKTGNRKPDNRCKDGNPVDWANENAFIRFLRTSRQAANPLRAEIRVYYA